MWIPDINALLYAHNPQAARHREYRAWLEAILSSGEAFLLPEVVWTGFLRLATAGIILQPPATMSEAIAAIGRLREAPGFVEVARDAFPGFSRLAIASSVSGRHAPDILLAAIAIEHNATLYSADGGFRRFPALTWKHPLDS
jgi:uncharacterized protein